MVLLLTARYPRCRPNPGSHSRASRALTLVQRVQAVDEVSNLVVYLCSPQASATTGSALRAEGGIIEAIC